MCVYKYLYMLSTPNSVFGHFTSPDLLYVIRGNGNFSEALLDSSFPIWRLKSYTTTAIAEIGKFHLCLGENQPRDREGTTLPKAACLVG